MAEKNGADRSMIDDFDEDDNDFDDYDDDERPPPSITNKVRERMITRPTPDSFQIGSGTQFYYYYENSSISRSSHRAAR